MTTVLVTGAGGYIGQRITNRLAADGVSVRAVVRSPVPWTSGLDGQVEQVVGDLVQEPGLAKEVAVGVDTVIHLAGANEVAAAESPEQSVADTVAAAEAVAGSGVGRIVYLSTVHVYGPGGLAPGALVSEDTPPAPAHPYAAARLACEGVFERSGVPSLVFRLTNGVGAPSRVDVARWSLVANELCREGALSGTLTLRTPGVQWRDFVALLDVESILRRVVEPAAFQPGLFNLGSGTSVTIRDLAAVVQDSFVGLGQPRPELVAPPAPPDPPGPYRVDVSRLARLGVSTVTPLRAAVDETVAFCLEHREALR